MNNPSLKSKSMAFLKRWGARLLIVPPIAIAIAILFYFVENRSAPKERGIQETSRPLSVIAAPEFEVRPKVIGFGTAEYARKWRAVTQVAGRIESIHKELRPGSIIVVGEQLLKIDDADYRSEVEELTASIEQKEAEIQQLKQTETNYGKSIKLEQEVLSVLQGELRRAEALAAERAGSQGNIDTKQRAVVAQRQVILELENNRDLIGPQIQALEAGIRQSNAQREKAARDIERTAILAPFTMRVGDVDLEEGQYVSANESLFEGFSFSEMEIEVQISMLDIRRLLSASLRKPPEPGELTMDNMRSVFQVTPIVTISGAGADAFYPGKFLRIREVVDSQTRQVGLVIGVLNQPADRSGTPKPPVLEGAFCKVTLVGEPVGKHVVIPRSAVHGDTVYTLDDEKRLASTKVEVKFSQDDYSVIESGLNAGSSVVVANPSPAVDGMLIEPSEAKDVLESLKNALESNE